MTNPILYRNSSNTVLLLDLLSSVQQGQCSPYLLRGSRALESPYASTEPKGVKRDAIIASIPPDERSYHASVQRDVSLALAEIRECLHKLLENKFWCYSRLLLTTKLALNFDTGEFSAGVPVILSTTEQITTFSSIQDFRGNVVCNLRPDTSIAAVTGVGNFLIPPASTFILASLDEGLPTAREHFISVHFDLDLILMDPPWSNRSVRHAGVYKTQECQSRDPFDDALGIVDEFLAPAGWVVIWVTNKSSVRARVLKTLHDLRFQLYEEWVWIKTTVHGEPVTELDGIWRRPYEVALLFRRIVSSDIVKRRVIAAVPDLHSRKPCLKTILEEILPHKYRALELFARSLTAGWCSFGDEVLKFQNESHWDRSET